ncbi:TlpA disulfide reductase family protein [Lederbergia lenta]|uniref:Alkyl hydroperoxide reductase/ thiol specific antioxidant/ Mal allergen n=1 Tax=Lederbergia lenta TaxID=1467 RepID=A0A2X4W6D9_LEDLE|nr:TlpA disulfide reductase family protein [Lederbergia lenta]MEC2324489.1 TlpA disulfide reductase family protein [Lederbergia lenta]SQI59786.1 alkyl hydroperoxide reductase/ thiol specific antioxidant/ Mal allergen [Lederbergia lenta]
MKNVVFIVIVIGLVGWTTYELLAASNEKAAREYGSATSEQIYNSGEISEYSNPGIRKGELAPDFELTTLDGEVVKLSDYRGKRVMLNFWATWCPPCRAEMPDMQKFQDNKDVQVLAVNLSETESSSKNVPKFVDELNLSLKIPLDNESAVSKEFQVLAYPTTYMIDSNGRIQFVMMGAMNYDFMVQQFEMMQ